MDWTKHITAASMALLLFSCSDLQEGVDNHGSDIRISVPVKSDGWSQPTYRILNFNGVYGSNIYRYLGSDTFYWKAESDEELTSCILNQDGTFSAEKNTVDLNANGKRIIVMTSPGKSCGDAGSYEFLPAEESLYMTDPQDVQLGDYGLIRFNSGLIDRRIRLKVNFYKGAGVDMDDFSITGLNVVGGGNLTSGVTYYPATRQAVPLDPAAELSFSLTSADAGTKDEDGNELLFCSVGEKNMLASGFYAPKATVAAALGCQDYHANLKDGGDYLYLTCKMTQGSQQADLRIALTSDTNPELLAENNYDVNIIVRSNYINVEMAVYKLSGSGSADNDWEQDGSDDNIIEEPLKIDLGEIRITGGWTSVDPGGQEIK